MSAIITVCNVKDYLSVYQSVLNWTYDNLDIILIDDGSFDESVAIFDSLTISYVDEYLLWEII